MDVTLDFSILDQHDQEHFVGLAVELIEALDLQCQRSKPAHPTTLIVQLREWPFVIVEMLYHLHSRKPQLAFLRRLEDGAYEAHLMFQYHEESQLTL